MLVIQSDSQAGIEDAYMTMAGQGIIIIGYVE